MLLQSSVLSTHIGHLTSLETPAPGHLMPYSGLSEHLHISKCAYTHVGTHIHTQKGGLRNLAMR